MSGDSIWELLGKSNMLIGLGGAILTVLLFIPKIISFFIKRKREKKKYFIKLWKKPNKISFKDLNIYQFKYFFYQREFDNQILHKIETGQNLLLLGKSLSGKTRSIFENFKKINKDYRITLIRNVDIDNILFKIPKGFKNLSKKIVVIDDLQKFVSNQGNEILIKQILSEKIQFIATCRTGDYLLKTKATIQSNLGISLEEIFNHNLITINPINEKEGKKIASELNLDWKVVRKRFDGTVGSLLMRLGEMERRYSEDIKIAERTEELIILQELKRMYISGLYYEKQSFPLHWLKKICIESGISKENIHWQKFLSFLNNKEFITKWKKDSIEIEESYLENIIFLEPSMTNLNVYQYMFNIFQDDYKALLKIGNNCTNEGEMKLEDKRYLLTSIDIYTRAREKVKNLKNSTLIATFSTNISNAYIILSQVEQSKEFCLKAIEIINETLKIKNISNNKLIYSSLHSILGNAYSILSMMSNKRQNSKLAIKSYTKALEFSSKDAYPYEYWIINNNLGNTYASIQDIEDNSKNIKKSIEFYEEAVSMDFSEISSSRYSLVLINLAAAYFKLVEFENQIRYKIEYLEISENHLLHAFDIISKEKNTELYYKAKYNLGYLYSLMGEIMKDKEKINISHKCYKESLSFYNKKEYPRQYAMTLNSIAVLYYVHMAYHKNNIELFEKGEAMLKEAIDVRRENKFKIEYADTYVNLGNLYLRRAELGEKLFCKKAEDSYRKSLRIYEKEQIKRKIVMVQKNIEGFNKVCI